MTTDQRNSYRCQNTAAEQKAVIKVGKREVVVELTNQSASGFSVTANENLRIRQGNVLFVRTSAGWFQAEVIYQQKRSGQTTLGLVRLADLPDPRDAQLVKPGGRKFERVGSASTAAGPILLLAIVAGLAFWGFLLNFTWFRGPAPAAGRHLNLGGYLSRVIEPVTPGRTRTPSAGVSAATDESTIE